MMPRWLACQRRLAALLALVLPAASFAADPGQAAVPADLGERLARSYAAPATARLAEAAQRLAEGLQGFCSQAGPVRGETAGKPGRDAIARQFRETVSAWEGVAFLRFGPLVEANRYERIAFWPDPRGVMQRQVQAALAEPGAAELGATALAQRSVAQQGLPALEFLLFRDQGLLAGKAPSPADCGFASAVAGALSQTTGELARAWSDEGDFARDFARPAAGNARYRSQQEVAAEAIKAMSAGLQFARDVKLMPVLQQPYQASRARRAPFWRSGQTAASMVVSLQGMQAFHEAANWHFGAADAWIDQSLRHELAQSIGVLQGFGDRPIAEVLEDPAGRRRLALLTMILKNAKALVDQDLAPHVGTSLGFNALDGD